MNYADLINTITTRIATNGQQAITAQVLQDVLVDMVQEMGQSGALVGGVVDTSYVPDPSNDAQLIYIAQGIGTYPNFGGLTVVDGEVAFFYYDGNAWQKSSVSVNVAVEVIDNLTSTATDKALSANQGRVLDEKKADKVSGATAGNMAGLDADGNLVDSGVPASAVGDVADKIDKVHDAEVGNVPMFKADGGIEDGGVAADNIAEQDGYYETLVAGAAENLIGRGSVPANYTRRRSGGGSIGSGAAVLEEIQGNTQIKNQGVQPQIYPNGTYYGLIVTYNADGSITLDGTASGNTNIEYLPIAANWAGHPYNNPTHYYYVTMGAYKIATFNTVLSSLPAIVTGSALSQNGGYPRIRVDNGVEVHDTIFPVVIDLTTWFGAGNEPSTVAELKALYPLIDSLPYNTGSLLNFTGTGLLTDGFNQWDEEWENGKYNTTTGEADDAPTQIRSKNYIPVFGGTDYYFQFPLGVGNLVIMRYDIDKNYLGYNAIQPSVRTLSADTRFIRFYMTVTYGTTYKNDICINFSDTARNGNYEPYWSETHTLPITTATSGGVAIFPDGEKSAGTAHDRYYKSAGSDLFDKAEKVIASVDMGDLGWSYYGSNIFMCNAPADALTVAATAQANIKSDTYIATTVNTILYGTVDKSIGLSSRFYVKDTAYSDAAVFIAAMQGKRLYYEVATPTDYTLDTPFSAQYRVDGMGTETLLPQNTATPTTTPINAEVKYPMNAVDTLRNLPQNYISKASMDAILTAFKTAGVITNYTLTWDATNQKYNCSITV